MLRYMSSVGLSPGNARVIWFPSRQLHRNYANVAICKYFRSLQISPKVSRRQLLQFTDLRCTEGSQLSPLANPMCSLGRQLHLGLSTSCRSMSVMLSLPPSEKFSKFSWNAKRLPWGFGGPSLGFCLSFATLGPVYAKTLKDQNNANGDNSESPTSSSHGKKVYTNYSVTGIPGDGRCLFRSVVHGACIRSGKSIPDEDLQRVLADELRAMVADEFVKRREETEWFIEGDFETYISQIRKPHVWGGEPELFMASHVLQMPITVYMHDPEAGGLIAIAEYGQEYDKENPIQVLYHGFGHYDALQIPGGRGSRSRL